MQYRYGQTPDQEKYITLLGNNKLSTPSYSSGRKYTPTAVQKGF